MDKEFNLLEEPWVRVLLPDGTVKEVSLPDALLHAHEFVDLAGEMPTQDVAMLRLLLAVLHTVFTRTDENGEASPLETPRQAKRRWAALWQKKQLPEKPLLDYFDRWKERFWLFHPERPFWQVPQASIGTGYSAAKLNGEILESSNKLRLFSSCSGVGKNTLTYAQAARWLLHLNGFDDTSAKPKKEESTDKLPSPGAGWLGKLGLITAVGNNLFETLLLNFVLLRDNAELWETPETPCWELDIPHSAQRTEIPLPNNAAALLTLQSRRLLLQRSGDKVTGYFLLGGDFFPKEDAFSEQMTLWSKVPDKRKNASPRMQPRRHDPARRIWQEFPSILPGGAAYEKDSPPQPGVIQWLTVLRKEKKYDRSMIRYRITAACYGDKDFFVNDSFSDTLAFHTDLLTELGVKWQQWIMNEIERCDNAAKEVGRLASDLKKAAGCRTRDGMFEIKTASEQARTQFYFALDLPFRSWLASIDPQTDDESRRFVWREQARRIALEMGERMVLQAGPAAFSGRTLKEKADKAGNANASHFSAPEAYNRFVYGICQIYPDTKS